MTKAYNDYYKDLEEGGRRLRDIEYRVNTQNPIFVAMSMKCMPHIHRNSII